MLKLFFVTLAVICLLLPAAAADLIMVAVRPTVHVLTIGIDNYRDPEYKLDAAVADSNAFKEALQDRLSGQQSVKVTQLLNEQATRAGIVGAFGQIAKQAAPRDVFIFYYSGMGGNPQNKDNDFYLFPYDGDSGSKTSMAETALSSAQIKGLMEQIAADHQVLFMDTANSADCFAALSQRFKSWASEGNRGAIIFGIDGRADEDEKGKNSYVTQAFLLGLAGEADVIMDGKNVVTAQELNVYLPQKVFQLSKGNQRLKSLMFGNDFPLAKAPGAAPATDGQGTMKSGIRLAKAPAPPAASFKKDWKDYALLIGVSEYDDKKSLKFLPNAVPDMESLKTDLEKIYGFDCKLLANPKKADVVQALDWYEENLTDKDRLLVCFSGHGERDEVGEGYLLLKDSALEGGEKYREYQRALQHSYLNRRLLLMKAHQIMLVLDSCYSGIFENTMKSGERTDDSLYRDISREQLIQRKIFAPSYKWFASGTGPTPDGQPGQHSPFMKAFLESLQTFGGEDSVLLASEIQTRLTSIDPEPKSGIVMAKEKTSSDFIFIAQDQKADR